MIWLAITLGILMSILWLVFLLVTRRLPNQPFRKWDQFSFVVFFLMTAVLIQWGLHFFNISEIHHRRVFGAIAMGLFLVSCLVSGIAFSSQRESKQ